MQRQSLKVMAVDDDEINLEILHKNLVDSGYETVCCTDGDDAWDFLEKKPDAVDIVLLDKMMPRMNGMEVLSRMQKHPMLKNIPVIIQTGDVGLKEVQDGLASGAYYYLCKPFDPDVMIALVNAVARDFVRRNMIYKEMKQEKTLSHMICEGKFTCKNAKEALRLSVALSHNAADPERANTAILELIVNAIEHGNLGLGYEEKSKLLAANKIDEEIERRLSLPENRNKAVEVVVKNKHDVIEIVISDEGNGFKWQDYMDFEPLRLTEPNGRGIATAKLMGVDIEYVEPGNKVICRFKRAR